MKKLPLYILGLIAFVWGLATISRSHVFWGVLSVMYASPIWIYPPLMVYDMWMAKRGKNSPYQRDFYKGIREELTNAAIVSLAIAGLYVFGGVKYDAASYDIVTAAFPFLLLGLRTMIKVGNSTIVDIPFKKKLYHAYLIMMIVGYLYIGMLALRVTYGDYSTAKSIWIQVTIVCASLFAYIETRRLEFVIQKERMETSPVLLDIFGHDGPYGMLTVACEKWNEEVAKRRQEIQDGLKQPVASAEHDTDSSPHNRNPDQHANGVRER